MDVAAQSLDVEGGVDKLQPKLGVWNYVNLAAYVVNAACTFASTFGAFGPTNTVLSAKYQTIITPAGGAFSIWGPIFIWELVFAAAQMTPQLRGSKLVSLVGPWWVAACAFQSTWSIIFAREAIFLSLVCMLGIFFSLLGLGLTADIVSEPTYLEYWLLRAPFSLHGGWILAASAVNSNVFAVSTGAKAPAQLSIAIASLAVVFAAAAFVAIVAPRPDVIVPLVAAWAAHFISNELQDPKNLNNAGRQFFVEWDPATLVGVEGAARILSNFCLALAGAALGLRLLRRIQRVPQAEAGKSTQEVAESGPERILGA